MRSLRVRGWTLAAFLGCVPFFVLACGDDGGDRVVGDDDDDDMVPEPLIVFGDGYGDGFAYFAFEETAPPVVDDTEAASGTASLRVDVPDTFFVGGAIAVDLADPAVDLSGYDAVTFQAKSSRAATLNVVGVGIDGQTGGEAPLRVEWVDVALTTEWTEYTIPLPNPAKLGEARALFHFAEGSDEGAYTLYLDDIRYVAGAAVSNPRPRFTSRPVALEVGETFGIGGTSVVFDVDGADVELGLGGGVMDFVSSDESVATVAGGLVTAVADGTAEVTGSLGATPAEGTLEVTVGEQVFVLRPLPEIYRTGKAINYSPYRAGGPGDPGELPSVEDIREDLTLLRSAGYDLLRLFGGDRVSERILEVARDEFPELRFQQGIFLAGVAEGATSCEVPVSEAQIETAIRLANTYESVVTVSVGNETSFFSRFMPPRCLEEYIERVRAAVRQPVTSDDDYTYYAGLNANFGERVGVKPDTVLPLMDFVAIHMYPVSYFGGWDWRQTGVPAGPQRAEALMNAALAEAQANYQAVYDYEYTNDDGERVTIGETLPIVVGETGWKARQTNFDLAIETHAANPVNAKWYYDLLLPWERSEGGPVTIFFFQAFDETWKGIDDGWGLWDEDRNPRYALCDTPAGAACNEDVYEGAGFFE